MIVLDASAASGCTGTSVTLWTGDIRYKSLAVEGP